MSNGVNLFDLFQTVTGTLQDNQSTLNKSDSHNGDHGDNMVQIFEVITQAMKEKNSASPADQLAYASDLLRGKASSGSAALYADGLSHASSNFQGQSQINPGNALQLVQSLMGGGNEPAPAPSDNPFGALLSGLTGGGQDDDDSGIGADDLINAGLSFLAAKNRGESNAEALMEAVVAGSPFGQTSHRAESSQLVMNTLFSALGSMTSK